MAKKNDSRVKITLACSECKQRNYDTEKNIERTLSASTNKA